MIVMKLWILGLLISSIINYRKKQTVLCCGIFGACLNPKIMSRGMSKAALAKFKMLGLYNMERGKHSCGVLVDEQIYKGTGDNKLFENFIIRQGFSIPESGGNFVLIGHTRQATGGSHSDENAHPFVIDNNFVLAHNGVIRNIWTLCQTHDISHSNIHVDSLGLAHLINKKGFGVLNEYEGHAALLMTKLDEPNSLYIYRGASRTSYTGEEEEERPLFYMQTEEGIYVSSLQKALIAISDSSSDKVKQVEANTVTKLTNGHMTKSKFVVDRGVMNIVKVASYPKQMGGTQKSHTGIHNQRLTSGETTGPTNSKIGQSHGVSPLTTFEIKIVPMIWHETLPHRASKFNKSKGVIFHVGRYWIVDHSQIVMAHGAYNINKRGIIHDHRQKDSENIFMFQGVLMRSKKAYEEAVLDEELKSTDYNFALQLSKYSDMPVSNTRADSMSRCKGTSEYMKNRWYMRGTLTANTGFTPKWSERNYHIKNGLLDSVECQHRTMMEDCINIAALEAERGKASAPYNNPAHLSPVVIPPTRPHPFENLPIIFKEDNTEFNVSLFYRVWESVDDALRTLTELQINTLRYYVVDIMMSEMRCVPDSIFEDEVDSNLRIMLASCVDTGNNIYEMWDKNYKEILDYMIVAEANPSGEVFAEIFKEETDSTTKENSFMEQTNYACEFVPKPIISETSVEQERSAIDENIALAYSLGQRNDDIDDDEAPIDLFIAQEQKRIAEFDEEDEEEIEKVEPLTSETEILYNLSDVVDFLCDTRDVADTLTTFVDDEFSQEVANAVYKTVDPLLHKLNDLCYKFDKKECIGHIERTLKLKLNTTRV